MATPGYQGVDIDLDVTAARPESALVERVLATLRSQGVSLARVEAVRTEGGWSIRVRGRCPPARAELLAARLRRTIGVRSCTTSRIHRIEARTEREELTSTR